MNKRVLIIVSMFVICSFLSYGCSREKDSKESVKNFNNLSADEMVSAMGPGWNLGNQLEAVKDGTPDETCYNNPVVKEELIKAVKNAGFKSIRIPISYMDYIGEGPEYKIDEKWMDRIEQVVDYCIKNELYVVIDVYADGYNSVQHAWLLCNAKDQTLIKQKYQAIWKQIAERYKEYDEHLIFESMNEEFNGNYNATDAECYKNINDYNQIFLDTIRQSGGNNDKRWVVVPGWNTNINFTNEASGFLIPEEKYLSKEVPTGSKRIMISVHYYHPWEFCGSENVTITQWGEDAKSEEKINQDGGEVYLGESFQMIKDNFISKGYPCLIGEYGAVDKTKYDKENTFYRADFCRKVCRKCVQIGCIPMYWDNGYNGNLGFALFNRSTYEVTQPEIVSAIMEEYYKKKESEITAINLHYKRAKLQIGSKNSETIKLNVTVEPPEAKEKLIWTSSDESIATVNSSGTVRARGTGKATITAESSDGKKDTCEVEVEEEKNVKLRMYLIETANWATIASKTPVMVSSSGGTYTLSLSADETSLKNIGALYIKDQAVQGQIKTRSNFRSAIIKINSIKFNGTSCTLVPTEEIEGINGMQVFDYCLINMWSAGREKMKEVKPVGANKPFAFAVGKYKKKNNVVEINFTIQDIILE